MPSRDRRSPLPQEVILVPRRLQMDRHPMGLPHQSRNASQSDHERQQRSNTHPTPPRSRPRRKDARSAHSPRRIDGRMVRERRRDKDYHRRILIPGKQDRGIRVSNQIVKEHREKRHMASSDHHTDEDPGIPHGSYHTLQGAMGRPHVAHLKNLLTKRRLLQQLPPCHYVWTIGFWRTRSDAPMVQPRTLPSRDLLGRNILGIPYWRTTRHLTGNSQTGTWLSRLPHLHPVHTNGNVRYNQLDDHTVGICLHVQHPNTRSLPTSPAVTGQRPIHHAHSRSRPTPIRRGPATPQRMPHV